MAAKLHIQQVHNGEGTIEAGAGPGVETVAPPSSPAQGGPPTAPIALDDIDDRKRERPTPRPLHQSNYEVPAAAMEAMLGVWDTIGTKRGVEGFIHSSMVLKVYAAKPSGPESAYTNMMPKPEGENPFAAFVKGVRKVWADPIAKQCPPVPFKIANGTLLSATNPAWAVNPYTQKSLMPRREVAKPVKSDEPTEAPVTPFGQLPKFGQQAVAMPAANQVPSSTETQPTNPFAAAAAAANPFAAAAQAASPFAQGTQSPSPFAQAASPFAQAAQAASPFAAAATSPFGAASPFAASPAASPFATGGTAPSPFTQSGSAASPFASPFASSPFPATSFPPFPGFEGSMGSVGDFSTTSKNAPTAEVEKKFTCSACGKAFRTELGLAEHNKIKHNIDMPRIIKDHKRKEKIPDLPAYVPSPVDLAGTSPFGSEPTSAAQRWSDVELIPHALAVNNITIVGLVDEIDASDASSSFVYLTVKVASDEAATGTENFVVQCTKTKVQALNKGTSVCVVGTLRLHPTLDEQSNKYYAVPIVHLSEANGLLESI